MANEELTLPRADLDHVLTHAAGAWDSLRGSRVFITGGTGFYGQWLVETLAHANAELALDVHAVVLTRDPVRALARAGRRTPPPGVTYHTGDVLTFAPPDGHFEWCIHAATDATPALNAERPEELLATTVHGTRAMLDFAATQPMRGVLLCSSGAVYGVQPPALSHIPEDHSGGPDQMDPSQAYAEGKRMSELLGAIAARRGVPVRVARGFAFVGPHLPLDAHFAVGNFLRDRLARRPITLRGDGTAVRSYLHAADLAIWLWSILTSGKSGRAYNVGSEHALSLWDVAHVVAGGPGPAALAVQRGQSPVAGGAGHRYVPSTQRAREELGVRERITIADAIERTIAWHQTRDSMPQPV